MILSFASNPLTPSDLNTIESFLERARSAAASPSAGNSDIVEACASGFGNGSSGSTCVQNAIDAAAVRACVSGFGNGSSGLDCASNARYDDVVRNCVSGFGNGSSGLACAKDVRDSWRRSQ